MIDDLATLPVPFFTYYDSSWDLLLSAVESTADLASLRAITPSMLMRRRDRQLAVYQEAAGVIAFSRWHARSLVEQSGVPPEKVHVALPRRQGPAGRFPSGRARAAATSATARGPATTTVVSYHQQHQSFDFYRKGGDLAVGALTVLRREYDPQITLTIVGVGEWPLPGRPPEGVSMLGALPAEEVRALYDSHDLFVMPSRFEPFGLVFAEAIARGLPSVTHNACAMPEIVTPGLSGALVNGDDERDWLASSLRRCRTTGCTRTAQARARVAATSPGSAPLRMSSGRYRSTSAVPGRAR